MRSKNLVLSFGLGFVLCFWGCATDNSIVDTRKAEAKKDLGLSYVGQGDLQGGLKELVEAAALDPQNAEIQNGLSIDESSISTIVPSSEMLTRRSSTGTHLMPSKLILGT